MIIFYKNIFFYIYFKIYILILLSNEIFNYNKSYTSYEKNNNFPKTLVLSNNSILFFSSNPGKMVIYDENFEKQINFDLGFNYSKYSNFFTNNNEIIYIDYYNNQIIFKSFIYSNSSIIIKRQQIFNFTIENKLNIYSINNNFFLLSFICNKTSYLFKFNFDYEEIKNFLIKNSIDLSCVGVKFNDIFICLNLKLSNIQNYVIIDEKKDLIKEYNFYSTKNPIYYNKIILLNNSFPIMCFLEKNNFLCFVYFYDLKKNILIEKFSPIKNNSIKPLMRYCKNNSFDLDVTNINETSFIGVCIKDEFIQMVISSFTNENYLSSTIINFSNYYSSFPSISKINNFIYIIYKISSLKENSENYLGSNVFEIINYPICHNYDDIIYIFENSKSINISLNNYVNYGIGCLDKNYKLKIKFIKNNNFKIFSYDDKGDSINLIYSKNSPFYLLNNGKTKNKIDYIKYAGYIKKEDKVELIGNYCKLKIIILDCYETCFNCTKYGTIEENNCDICNEDYYKIINTNNCNKICNGYYFIDKNKKLIDKCYKNCLTCSDKEIMNENNEIEYMNCILCQKNYYKKIDNCINCYEKKPIGYYFDEIEKIFKKCHKNCKDCISRPTKTNNKCINCIENYYKKDDELEDNCYMEEPIGYKLKKFPYNIYLYSRYYDNKFNYIYNKCLSKNNIENKFYYKGKCLTMNELKILNIFINDININLNNNEKILKKKISINSKSKIKRNLQQQINNNEINNDNIDLMQYNLRILQDSSSSRTSSNEKSSSSYSFKSSSSSSSSNEKSSPYSFKSSSSSSSSNEKSSSSSSSFENNIITSSFKSSSSSSFKSSSSSSSSNSRAFKSSSSSSSSNSRSVESSSSSSSSNSRSVESSSSSSSSNSSSSNSRSVESSSSSSSIESSSSLISSNSRSVESNSSSSSFKSSSSLSSFKSRSSSSNESSSSSSVESNSSLSSFKSRSSSSNESSSSSSVESSSSPSSIESSSSSSNEDNSNSSSKERNNNSSSNESSLSSIRSLSNSSSNERNSNSNCEENNSSDSNSKENICSDTNSSNLDSSNLDSSSSSDSSQCKQNQIILYSSTLIIFVLLGIIGAILSKKKKFVSNEINIKNDDIIIKKIIDITNDTKNFNNNENTVTMQSNENQNTSKIDSDENFSEEESDVKNKLSFKDKLFSNFLKLYPFCFIRSNINPIIMKLFMLMFNFLNYFNFNTILNKEKFGNVFLALLIQMFLCVIIKCIYIVNKNDRDKLENNLKHCVTEKEREKKCNEFNQSYFLKRVLAIILIIIIEFSLIILIFKLYENKCNWENFGWTCFFAWVIFAPIFIILVSFIELKINKNNEKLIYYIKQLFCF